MDIKVLTGKQEQILELTIRVTSGKPEKICIVACDAEQNNTVFTNRYNVFDGDQMFLIRMPLSPAVTLLQIYNQAYGNRPEKQEDSFVLLNRKNQPVAASNGIYRRPLEKKLDVVDMGNPDVRSFVKFVEGFCFYLGIMDTRKEPYQSPDGRIKINFMPTITRTSENGSVKESTTPARINSETKIIDVSQKVMLPFTVPMRFAIMCHEFAHCYLNATPENEIEADLQGLLIYLGLGFPRIEAYQAFAQTFQGAATPLNEKRYRILKRFIDDFEKNKMMIYEG